MDPSRTIVLENPDQAIESMIRNTRVAAASTMALLLHPRNMKTPIRSITILLDLAEPQARTHIAQAETEKGGVMIMTMHIHMLHQA